MRVEEQAARARRGGVAPRLVVSGVLMAGGLLCFWRLRQSLRARLRARILSMSAPGPMESLPHSDPRREIVETASEDSFPASDPPAYTAQDRLGPPLR